MSDVFTPGARGRAVDAWAVIYPDPLVVRAGERVALGRTDDEWPFIWCTAGDGTSGWLPLSLVERAGDVGTLRRDYTTQELGLAVGDLLTLHEELAGWYWATNQAGQSGWVPARAVALLRPDEPAPAR